MVERRQRFVKPAAFGIAGVILLALPQFIPEYHTHLMTTVLFFGYLGTAWNILGGYAGQFSFGHTAFFGLGAFTSSLLQLHAGVNPWIGMIFAGIIGTIMGLFIGSLCFRYGLKGPFFALAMLALAEMLRLVSIQMMTEKYPLGIYIPMQASSLLNFQFRNKVPYYYIILLMTVGALLLVNVLEKRRIGSYFKAIRENEGAAESLGVNAFKYKLLAMGISAFMTAIGGTFYAQYYLTLDDEAAFGVANSIEILLGPIIGGAGTVFGPVLGAGILEFLSETSRNFLGGFSGAHLMVYGAVLIIVIVFLPDGILGGLKMAFYKISRSKQE
jgi:branched-chain amino acid transport system permease protein